jgi:hypothetical protein
MNEPVGNSYNGAPTGLVLSPECKGKSDTPLLTCQICWVPTMCRKRVDALAYGDPLFIAKSQ